MLLAGEAKSLPSFFYYFFKSFYCCCCCFSLPVEAKHSSFFEDKGDLPNNTFFIQLLPTMPIVISTAFSTNSTA